MEFRVYFVFLRTQQWKKRILSRCDIVFSENNKISKVPFSLGNSKTVLYRVGHLLADLGLVDLDLESSQAGGPLMKLPTAQA